MTKCEQLLLLQVIIRLERLLVLVQEDIHLVMKVLQQPVQLSGNHVEYGKILLEMCILQIIQIIVFARCQVVISSLQLLGLG